MNRTLRNALGSVALAASAFSAPVHATVLTFDNLTGSGFFDFVYNGFSFGNLNPATNPWFWSDTPDPVFTAHSGATSVSTDASKLPAGDAEAAPAITSLNGFVFQGAFFSGPSLNDDGTAARVSYELFNGSNLVFTSGPSAELTDASSFFASGYGGLVTSVVIVGPQGGFAMDDFTFQSVPEPASLALLGGGLALLAGTRLRKRSTRY